MYCHRINKSNIRYHFLHMVEYEKQEAVGEPTTPEALLHILYDIHTLIGFGITLKAK